MEEKTTNVWKSSLNWGLILGIVLIIYSVLMYFLDLSLEKWVGWISYIFIAGGIVFATISYRDKELGGYIKYGQALGFGTLVVLFAAIISSIYSYLQMTVIDPDMVGKMLEMAEEELIKRGMPDEQIEMAVEMQKKFMKPGVMIAIAIPATTFMGFLISLITSIFLKKEAPEASFTEEA